MTLASICVKDDCSARIFTVYKWFFCQLLSGVSICTLVPVKQVNWVPAKHVDASSSGVSICTFVLAKQVNWVPAGGCVPSKVSVVVHTLSTAQCPQTRRFRSNRPKGLLFRAESAGLAAKTERCPWGLVFVNCTQKLRFSSCCDLL